MAIIIGRDRERKILEEAYGSQKPEFIVVYGRRRVGKTYLIRNSIQGMKDTIFFYVTGKKNGTMAEQIKHFMSEIGQAFLKQDLMLGLPENWDDAFKELTKYISASTGKKIVLFFDEFPWMVSRRSDLLSTLDEYWNHRWSRDPRIKLIVCGSSAEWLIKRIIKDKGGFYNRVTKKINLQPFTLGQARSYLRHNKIRLSNKQISHLYMVLGGIPYYLDQVRPGLSAAQAIEDLAFGKESFLLTEFEFLYAALFNDSDVHVDIVRTISKHPYGVSAQDLTREIMRLHSGAGLTSRLDDLVNAGFVERFKPYKHKSKGHYFKIVDEYTVFYFHWIEPLKDTLLEKGMRSGYWVSMQNSQAWHSWAGMAFEALCNKHISQISHALNLSPTAIPASWRFAPIKGTKDEGAQIDLLFDRDDGVITLCEIKYTDQPFVLDKAYTKDLLRKMTIFKQKTKTTKDLFWAFIAANGLKKTIYSEEYVAAVVEIDQLYES